MSDQGPISYILRISITCDCSKKQIYLHQPCYASLLLEWFNMHNCNPSSTPADPLIKLVKPLENEIINDKSYCQAVSSIIYLMLVTWPDLAATIMKLSQFTTGYSSTHWTALKWVLHYIRGMTNYALTLSGPTINKTPIELHGYCDADWAGDIDDQWSTSGYVFSINLHVISWQSWK